MARSPSADRLLEFKAIVDTGSISRAADQLGLTRPTLSRRLAKLEEKLELRLLQRTSRDLFPTPAGRELYLRAEWICAEIDATWQMLKQHDDEPRGPLRISVPESEFAAASLFTDFSAEFPKVELDVVITNQRTDLREAGIDVALVFGDVTDASLIVKSIFTNKNYAMATRAYLERCGMPQSVQELEDHECIVLRGSDGIPQLRWPLVDGGTIKVRPRMIAAGYRLMVQAVNAGLGIGIVPQTMQRKNPDLVALFPEDLCRVAQLKLVYVERKFQLPHVRAFIERSDRYWREWLMNW